MPKAKTKTVRTKPAELGLKGKGAEPLHIPEIEEAADKYMAARDEAAGYVDVETEAKTELMAAVVKHKAKLVMLPNGGVSYRFGDKLVELAPSKEKLSVKSIHDDTTPIKEG